MGRVTITITGTGTITEVSNLDLWPRHYDWDGHPITIGEWIDLNGKERRVGKAVIRRGAETFRVSTVYLGLDHGFGRGGPPIIFETMIFPGDDWTEVYRDRYSTLKQARAGHRTALKTVWRMRWDHKQVIHKGGKP